ncbi:MAG: serine--tRNA ligase [Patescibacteria group bacterium]|jgi:seryl-tRNA synthetase
MLDIKYIRDNAAKVKKAAKDKNISLDVDRLLELDEQRRKIMAAIDDLRAKRNELAQAGKSGKPSGEQIEKGKKLKEEIAGKEDELKSTEGEYEALMVKTPTIPSADTPIGKDESGNMEVFNSGELPKFSFQPKNHIELAENLDIIDFERGAKVAGYRGYYLKNEGASLVMALMMFAYNKMISKGFAPFIPPTMIREFALFGSGYFDGREYNPETDNIYQVATRDKELSGEVSREKKFLIGTAEPSLLAYFSDQVLKEEDLPVRVCGFSPCYRSEIGSYGKDTKGLYRVHEFFKIEQVVVSAADYDVSTALQEEMVAISEELHRDLGLPYRKLQICTGDMSAGKYRAFDLEAWLPGTGRWAETGSASNFADWQARRLNIKYQAKNGERKFAFLLNNTALPSVRPLIAILENYQQADGSVVIPEVLKKYMPEGMEVIKKK